MSLGPCFLASPSSAALPFSRFVAAPVPTPRAAARGGGPGCRGGGCRRRPLAVVVPVPSLVSSPFPRRCRPRSLAVVVLVVSVVSSPRRVVVLSRCRGRCGRRRCGRRRRRRAGGGGRGRSCRSSLSP